MACCYSRSVLMAMYPETEGCKCCHFKRRRDRVLRKKVQVEIVTTNTAPLPTDDVDELVSMIEGTHVRRPKSGASGEASKSAKKLKKERQREKKRLEEEAFKRLEEERIRLEEEARIHAEEAAREELLRKKREKKKKQRHNKKAAKTVDPITTIQFSDQRPSAIPVMMATDIGASHTDKMTQPTKSSEMVTIRRHSFAPDTTVTISRKTETGSEHLLYTLVNGQVYADPIGSPSDVKESIPVAATTKCSTTGKAKGKRNKKQVNVPQVSKPIFGKENGHDDQLEKNLRKHEPNWFSTGSNITVSTNPAPCSSTSTCTTPVIPNGPPVQCHSTISPHASIRTNGNSFSVFSEFEETDAEIDLSMIKLPPGITITKVNQNHPVSESGSALSDNGDMMPPPGVGHYNIDSNMIVMNPDCDEGDEDSYNSDDYLVYGKRRVTEFETVLSNKEKRKRSKANKCEDMEGNGSSERPTSREQTPGGATGGKNGKRGSDAGLKSSSNTNTRRNSSGSGKSSTDAGGGKKGDKFKDNRKGRREQQRTQAQGKGIPDCVSETMAPRFVKLSKDPSCSFPYYQPRTSPIIPSPGSVDISLLPNPLPRITPQHPVKMADLVSGAHQKVARNSDPCISGISADDFLSSRSQDYSQTYMGRSAQDENIEAKGCISQASHVPTSINNNSYSTNGKNSVHKGATDTISNCQKSEDNICGGNYNMWSSTPRQVSPESDFHSGVSGGSSDRRSVSCYSPIELFTQKSGMWKWPWAFDQDTPAAASASSSSTRPSTFGIRTITPPCSAPSPPTPPPPVSYTSTTSSSLNYSSKEQPNLNNFLRNGDTLKQHCPHPFVTTRQQDVTSPLPLMSGHKQQHSPLIYNRPPPLHHPQPITSHHNNCYESEIHRGSGQVSYPPKPMNHGYQPAMQQPMNFGLPLPQNMSAQGNNYCLPPPRPMTMGEMPLHYAATPSQHQRPSTMIGQGNPMDPFLVAERLTPPYHFSSPPMQVPPAKGSPSFNLEGPKPTGSQQYTLF